MNSYDPKRQLGSEPSPEVTDHAQGFYALFAVVGLMLIGLLIWSV